MKILFSGGGTLGPVTPLIAVIEEMRAKEIPAEFVWLGTASGVEWPLLRSLQVKTLAIPAGKWRRYFSWQNFLDLGLIIYGFFVALKILRAERPAVVVTTGGFVSVPVHYAAQVLGIPQLVHQQDVEIGLANRLMSWCADKITVSVPGGEKAFAAHKTILLGNPVRRSIVSADRTDAQQLFKLNPDMATVFIFGGGTGAEIINAAVEEIVEESVGQFQIIHVTGPRRAAVSAHGANYHPYPFFVREMAAAYAAADLVVGRAGFSTITELAAWSKPAILIPKYHTHQEKNAAWVKEQGAAEVLSEEMLTGERLLAAIRGILTDAERYRALARGMHQLFPPLARERLMEIIIGLVKKKGN